MRLFIIIVIMVLLALAGSTITFAQGQVKVNLVPNGDFETYSKCPFDADQIMMASGWTPIDTITKSTDNQGNPNCSAEYYNECSTNRYSFSSIPRSYAGYQYAHGGRGMACVVMFVDYDSSVITYYLRDYIQSRLTKKLTAGKSYCTSFFVNLAEVSEYGIKEISAYFDNGAIDSTKWCGLPQTKYTPQVTNTGGVITDTGGWTKIEGSFVATGKEAFITIGNFKDRLTTTAVQLPYNGYNGTSHLAYYFIDDVSVVETGTKADAGPDTHVGQGDSVYIGRPSSEALDCTWTKFGSSTIIGQGPGIWVKPTVATSYVVTQTLCGAVTKDTVKVDVWKLGVSSINGQTQDYSLAPNPFKGVIVLHQQVGDDKAVGVVVSNALGAVVYSAQMIFKDGDARLSLEALPAGFYTVRVKDSEMQYNLKLIKE